jgi:hypothetical protein
LLVLQKGEEHWEQGGTIKSGILGCIFTHSLLHAQIWWSLLGLYGATALQFGSYWV